MSFITYRIMGKLLKKYFGVLKCSSKPFSFSLHRIDFLFVFGFLPIVLVSIYGHVGTVSSPSCHRRYCAVSLSKNINASLQLVQPGKTLPFITENLLMVRKESN